MSINRVSISGNLTRDPELKATQGGTSMLSFGVAVNERKKNQQTGEWENVPNYIDCIVWGNRAPSLAQYLSKGTKVAIDGHLRQSSWTAQDGTKRSKVEVVVDEIEFMSRQQGQQQYAPQQQAPQQQYYPNQAPAGYQAPQQYQQVELYDESIPF